MPVTGAGGAAAAPGCTVPLAAHAAAVRHSALVVDHRPLTRTATQYRTSSSINKRLREAIAKAFDKAVHDALASGKIKSLSAGKMGMGTREVGDMIAKLVS